MKKSRIWLVILGVILLTIILIYSSLTGSYNSMVKMDEDVKASWAQVENQYQRRYDLIPNLVETVKGYANQEQETLTAVTEARSRAGGVMQMDESLLDNPEAFARFQEAQSVLVQHCSGFLWLQKIILILNQIRIFLHFRTSSKGLKTGYPLSVNALMILQKLIMSLSDSSQD